MLAGTCPPPGRICGAGALTALGHGGPGPAHGQRQTDHDVVPATQRALCTLMRRRISSTSAARWWCQTCATELPWWTASGLMQGVEDALQMLRRCRCQCSSTSSVLPSW